MDNLGYPSRAIRTHDFLYIRNFKPERWPAGDPDGYWDIDESPSKMFLLAQRNSEKGKRLFELTCGRNPAEQLFDIRQDPGCLNNLAGKPEQRQNQEKLWAIDQGKVRFIGASNYSGARLREALETSAREKLPAYQSIQPLYNLLERRDYEASIAPVVKEFDIAVLPYFSLAAGFLTGKYRSKADIEGAARGSMVEKYLNDRGLAILGALDVVAAEHNSTPARVALAWL